MTNLIEVPLKPDAQMDFKGTVSETRKIDKDEREDYRRAALGMKGIKAEQIAGPGHCYYDEDAQEVPLLDNEIAMVITARPKLFAILDERLIKFAEDRQNPPKAA